MSKIIIFIDGPFPTEADLELGEKLGTKCFRNAQKQDGSVEACDYATAVDLKLVPAGYATSLEEKVVVEAPVVNPTAPKAKATVANIMVPKG
jgi:hypothetical protein